MDIVLTEKAANEVKRIIAESGESLFLRLRIVGGGCSGFSSKLDLEEKFDEEKDNDLGEKFGVRVIVDKRSGLYCNGAIIDFVDDLNRNGFKVDIPGATGRCGCGSSFSF